jgi:ATP-binding cassette subfamily B protein
MRKGKTTILIAHRISTVENMDKIIYLEGGRVSDCGTHAELYSRCESYRNLVELQRLDDAGDEAPAKEVSANA